MVACVAELAAVVFCGSDAGTLVANVVACVADFVAAVLSVRGGLALGSAGYPSLMLLLDQPLRATVTGFGGCLSTVSTWVVEVSKMGDSGAGVGDKGGELKEKT